MTHITTCSINVHPDFDSHAFKDILVSVNFARLEINNTQGEQKLYGWVISKREEKVSIVIKKENVFIPIALNIKREDVKDKFLKRENMNVPLLCGFSYPLDNIKDFEIYIKLDYELFAWKQVKYTVIEEYDLSILKNILINISLLTKQELTKFNCLSQSSKNQYITSVLSMINIFNANEVNRLNMLSSEEKSYLEKFVKKINSPHILADFLNSINKTGIITLESPFSDNTATLSFNFSYENVNYLKFHSDDGDFYIIQFLHTVEAIYFPQYNLLFRTNNNHLDIKHVENMLYYVLSKLDLSQEDSFHKTNLKYQGLVLNGISPYHFYYDVLPALAYLNYHSIPLEDTKNIFSLNAKSYFSVKELYELDAKYSAKTSEELQSFLSKNNAFVLQVGNSYKNISNKIIEDLDKKLVSKSLKDLDPFFKKEVKNIEESDLVLWVGISSQKRAWLNQNDLIIKLINTLAKKYDKLTVIFDGMTKSIFDMDIIEKAVTDDDLIVKHISAALKGNIYTINLVNKKSNEKIYFASYIDFFLSNYSTGSMYPSRMLKKHGVTHLSNEMFNIVKDIHIHYNIYNFSKDAIIDIPDKKNSRVDFISYEILEDIFLSKTLNIIDALKIKNNFIFSASTYVFLHIPKTAGTSFRISIENKLKIDHILYDYGAHSKTTSPLILDTVYNNNFSKLPKDIKQNNIQFVIGHFHVDKYFNILKKANFMTFLRDPIQRIVSEYNHKKRLDGYDRPFKEFYMQENQQNKQFKYLSGIDIEKLFFIGLTEEYEKSIELFNKLTKLNIDILELNKGKKVVNINYDLPAETISILKKLNEKDIELYEKVKIKFYLTLKKYGIN